MKTSINVQTSLRRITSWLLCVSMLTATLCAQESFQCHTGDVASGGGSQVVLPPEPLCWPDYDMSCEAVTGFAPNPDSPEDTPIKYVKVVLHVFQNWDDPNVIHPP